MTTIQATEIRTGDRFEYGAEVFTAHGDARDLAGDIEIEIGNEQSMVFPRTATVRKV